MELRLVLVDYTSGIMMGLRDVALKGMPYFKANPNTLATVKDWVNPMVTNSITIAKDTLKE